VAYNAKVNSFLPAALAPGLAVFATIAELALGLALLLGIWRRPVAWASCGLLTLFALAMTFSFGVKAPLNFSVFVDAAAALLLAAWPNNPATRFFPEDKPTWRFSMVMRESLHDLIGRTKASRAGRLKTGDRVRAKRRRASGVKEKGRDRTDKRAVIRRSVSARALKRGGRHIAAVVFYDVRAGTFAFRPLFDGLDSRR
jgi:hypothetical protein